MKLRFDPFELDEDRFELTRNGLAVALRPKVFDLLAVLVRERARVVRREELFERLWSTTAVGFGSLAGLVNELRSALGEAGRGPSSIRTVHARGYQFVAPVTAVEGGEQDGMLARRGSETAPAVPPCADQPASEDLPPETAVGWLGQRLTVAVGEVSRAGARALVATIATDVERTAWLASAAAAAIDAGFRPRFVTAPARVSDRSSGEGAFGPESAGMEGETPVPAYPGGGRVPIALCLEVQDPEAWSRVGGLRRLLDLLGRAPVLVIAALAASVGDPAARALVERDGRIEGVAELLYAGRRGENGLEDARWLGSEGVARVLRTLARADRAAFETALRSLGFEATRLEPIRTLRRVGGGTVDAAGSLEVDAV
jgi:DNA-binding winged helix-turn-helix (wHTH) protein